MAIRVTVLVGKLVGLGATGVCVGLGVNVLADWVFPIGIDDGVACRVAKGLATHPANIGTSITHVKSALHIGLFSCVGYSPTTLAC